MCQIRGDQTKKKKRREKSLKNLQAHQRTKKKNGDEIEYALDCENSVNDDAVCAAN